MKHEDLLAVYKRMLEWIDRRMEPDMADFHHESPETWGHAKEVAFQMYQDLRYLCEGGIPSIRRDHMIDESRKGDYAPYKQEGNPTEFPCVGALTYRGREFPVYSDDYSMSEFVVCDGQEIQVDSFGGETDWYYMLDKYIDGIR